MAALKPLNGGHAKSIHNESAARSIFPPNLLAEAAWSTVYKQYIRAYIPMRSSEMGEKTNVHPLDNGAPYVRVINR